MEPTTGPILGLLVALAAWTLITALLITLHRQEHSS